MSFSFVVSTLVAIIQIGNAPAALFDPKTTYALITAVNLKKIDMIYTSTILFIGCDMRAL